MRKLLKLGSTIWLAAGLLALCTHFAAARVKRGTEAQRATAQTPGGAQGGVPTPPDGGQFDAFTLTDRLNIAATGQSNHLGSDNDGGSTVTLYDGLRASDAGINALSEVVVGGSNETPNTAMANWISMDGGTGPRVFVGNWAVGSTPYSGLAQGTTPYNRGLTQVTTAATYTAANRPSERFCNDVLAVIHGENDEGAGMSAATYATNLQTWRTNWEADTGNHCTGHTWMFLMQHAASAELNPPVTTLETSVGMDIADRASDYIIVCAPQYPGTWIANNPHHVQTSARRMGYYLGKCIYRTLVQEQLWVPLRPSTITATNNVVTVCYEGGDGSALVFDTTNLTRKGLFYGFDYSDSQADIPAIASVALNGTRCVDITLSRNAQSPARVKYATYSASTIDPGNGQQLSAGGNLRDGDTTSTTDASDAVPLYNWSIIFDSAVDSVSGSASATEPFSNTQSVDGNGVARSLISAQNLTTCNGQAACSFAFHLRSNAATWPTAANAILAKAASGQRQFDIRTTATAGTLRFFASTTVSDAANFCTTLVSGFTGNTWYHIVWVGPSNTLYVNGVLTTCTVTGTMPSAFTTVNSDFEVFNSADAQPANFNMAHFAIWQRALSLADAIELNGGAVGSVGTPIDPMTLSTGAPCNDWEFQGTYADRGTCATRNLRPYGTIIFEAIHP